MIEKLTTRYPDFDDLKYKVNEVVDVVNELKEFADIADKNLSKLMEEATCDENVRDKFAEQRKWVGKICRFWNWDDGLVHYSKLITIKETNDGRMSNCPFRADDGGWYMHCERVLPTDDAIYKGGNNE